MFWQLNAFNCVVCVVLKTILLWVNTWAMNHDISSLNHHFIPSLSPVLTRAHSLLTIAAKNLQQIHYFRFPTKRMWARELFKIYLAPHSPLLHLGKVKEVIWCWKYLTLDLVSLSRPINRFRLALKAFFHSTKTTGDFVSAVLRLHLIERGMSLQLLWTAGQLPKPKTFLFLNWTSRQA